MPRPRKKNDCFDVTDEAEASGLVTARTAPGQGQDQQLREAEEHFAGLESGVALPTVTTGSQRARPVRKRKAPVKMDFDDDSASDTPSPKASKSKKKKKEPKPEKEKRLDTLGRAVMYRGSPSQAVQDRIQRALGVGAGASHRLYLIDTKQLSPPTDPEGGAQEFTVLGATGNVYTVKIQKNPSCSCPDFRRGNLCKHILFCFLRVLKCNRDDPTIWQKALLPAEVSKALSGFGAGAVDQCALAAQGVRLAYAVASGTAAPADLQAKEREEKEQAKKGRPVEGDCPICYEEMKAGGEAVCTCDKCGNHAHKMCFDRWCSTKQSSGAPVSCVWCRARWNQGVKGPGAIAGIGTSSGSGMGSGYLNLAGAAGVQEPTMHELYRNADFINARATGRGWGYAIANSAYDE